MTLKEGRKYGPLPLDTGRERASLRVESALHVSHYRPPTRQTVKIPSGKEEEMIWQDLGSPWNPWQELNRLQEDLNRAFSGARTADTYDYPPMNIWANEESAICTAEIPGLDPEDIEVSVVHDTVTVKGTRRPEELQEGERYHRRERGFGDFTRTFQLPFAVAQKDVEARVSKGVLYIVLPRAEEDRPKRISVQSA
jgi:HSP20 family protein